MIADQLSAHSMSGALRAGAWFLQGFADAYAAHWAVTPEGPAGDEYLKGYALGVARVREEFFAALSRLGASRLVVLEDSLSG